MQRQCDGCNEPASSFQCPLCQAELITDRGFFCGQECFAKNWLQHRRTFHKSGVVRAKQPRGATTGNEGDTANGNSAAATNGDETQLRKKKRKGEKIPGREQEENKKGDKLPARPVVGPWTPLPRGDDEGRVEPQLLPGVPRAIIGGASSERSVAFWSAAHAAASHIVTELLHKPQLRDEADSEPLKVLVITADALGAHAMAWACRCSGLGHLMQLVVKSIEASSPEVVPFNYFGGERRVVITTQEIVGNLCDGSAAAWFSTPNNLLVTLPGVKDAGKFQSVHMRALFFLYSRETGESMREELPGEEEEEITHFVKPLLHVPVQLHSLFDASGVTNTNQGEKGDDEKKTKKARLFRFDNNVSTSLARGDLRGALQHLVRLYSTERSAFEEVLANSFLASLGAASVAHAHHVLAYVLRELVDHSSRFKASQGATLKDMAIRALTRVIGLIQPIVAEDGTQHCNITAATSAESGSTVDGFKDNAQSGEGDATECKFPPPSEFERKKYFNHYSSAPNLALQATLCYLYPYTTVGVIDAWGAAWGVKKTLKGPEALIQMDKARKDAVLRLEGRYGTKLGPSFAKYLVVLMHFLYDAVAGYSLAVEDVEKRTLWSLTLQSDVGPLRSFLSNCFLLQEGKPALKKKPTLSARKTTPSADELRELRRMLPVRTGSVVRESVSLPWVDLPIVMNRELRVKQLQQQAVEEILMAMPRKPRPMYIGDVGNLVGRWFRFNARFDGVLGVSLMDFLIQHPEAFRVVGDLVTRRTAGTCNSVPIRFKDDSGDDDDDDNEEPDKSRRAKDRALLTGAKSGSKGGSGKELSARARKKAAAKEFNKSRFNRNYKPLDPSAKVPGYVRHAPRKVKGRGRKANKRNTKRG